MRSHHQKLSRSVAAVVALALAVLVGSNLATTGASASRSWWEPVDRPSPDSDVNVSGAPFKGTNAAGEVRGFADLHNHLMTNEGFGGRIICGKPFSEAGVADALKDCPEHYPNGLGALFEQLTGGGLTHDPNAWPTFKDWPRYNSMTHQQNYYAWVERAWRGGLRVLVSDLTSNGPLCAIYPYKDRGCDEMDSIRLQAAKTYQMQAFIDRMYGGEGQGWFRIVKSATEARDVAKQGKLAVVLGVETSEPFGCKQILDIAQCNRGDIDRGLDELYGLGVRSMFVCHKYDNALCGVRFDSGTNGVAVNAAQFLSTGTFWKTEQCAGPQKDNPIGLAGTLPDWAKLPAGVAMPTYSADAQCNVRGLTRLGEYAVRGLMQRGMMIELDHMSVKAADRTFDILESVDYPGVISSHSWMDASWRERAYKLGGVVATYGFNGQPFIDESRQGAALRAKYDRGLPFGADMNGVGSRPAPRGTGAGNQVTYPFTSVDGGSVIDKQVSGERTWDVNVDGAAHYGMLPDAVEELRKLGGQDVIGEMFRGAETYLDTWAATEQHQERVNLARGVPAAASSTEWNPFTSFAPGRALDGDVGTRWASGWSADQWLRVDLGTARTVGRVVTDWEAAYARKYRIEVSSDGSNWQTVWSTEAGGGGIETAKFTPVTARYVRIHGTERATSYGYSLWEVGVFAS